MSSNNKCSNYSHMMQLYFYFLAFITLDAQIGYSAIIALNQYDFGLKLYYFQNQ